MPYLPKPTEGGDFTPPPAGTHPAICHRFIDLGTQKSTFSGESKTQRKVMLSWEITDPDLRMEDGNAFVISQRYTWSMHEKATLRKTLEAWRGQPFVESDFGQGGFDVRKLLGVGCLLSILHADKDGKTYANIGAVMKLPKGMSAGELMNPTVFFSLDPNEFDRDVLGTLSDKLQEIIKASPEYQALTRPASHGDFVAPNFDSGGDPGWTPDAEPMDIPF